jgi:flagellar biosynthesis/type III secretory pathway chaperone
MPRPNVSLVALRRVLQEQLVTGRALVALAEASEQALIEGDALKLEGLASQQRTLLASQMEQETARQQVTRELSSALGQVRVTTMSALLPALPAVDAAPLELLRRRILDTERRMELVNQRNARLLENQLDFVKFSLHALTSAALRPARYGVNLAQLAAPSFYIDSKA